MPSWNDGPSKTAILQFVSAVTDEKGKDYVEPAERIAVFDNDGTLWVEQPMYTQLTFAFDRVKELAPQHPEWKTEQPFKALLEGDMETVGASGMKGIIEIVMATHSGMTAAEFEKRAASWIATAKHPKFKSSTPNASTSPSSSSSPTCAPMDSRPSSSPEAASSSCAPGRKGSTAFRRSRSWVPAASPNSRSKTASRYSFVCRRSASSTTRRASRWVSINTSVADRSWHFGNADADMQMIEYTMAGEGRRLGLFVHHTDAEREYAYDREGHIGTLDKALDQAAANGWIIVDMKKEWKSVFPDG